VGFAEDQVCCHMDRQADLDALMLQFFINDLLRL